VRALPDASEDHAIARAIIALGRSMQMRVVAEGVETRAQVQALLDMDCDEIQGYLLSPPLNGPDLALWLEDYTQSGGALHSNYGRVRDTGPITLMSMPDFDEEPTGRP
jgi:predicted signal transduction protein with EAL and GGDEF domain